MKILKLLSIFLMFTMSCVAPYTVRRSHTEHYRSDLIERLTNSTVALVAQVPPVEDGNGNVIRAGRLHPYCSGVFIDDTHILTAAHCTNSLPNVIIDFLEEDEELEELIDVGVVGTEILFSTRSMFDDDEAVIEDFRRSVVIRHSIYRDLALLKVKDGQKRFRHDTMRVAPNSRHMFPGQRIWAMGHPRGLMWNLTAGFISQIRGTDIGMGPKAQRYTVVNAFVYFGNSGGPLIDDYGNVVGIASMLKFDGNTSYFANINEINTFLR